MTEPTILEKITSYKKEEVSFQKERIPKESLIQTIENMAEPTRDFQCALQKENSLSIIAEIKRASPSAGIIRKDFDPTAIGKEYNNAKVDAISILTDEKFFGGRLEYLEEINKITSVPLLRKDFIIDEYQIYQSRVHHADAILLIASILSPAELKSFLEIAKNIGLHSLVECHSAQEIQKSVEAGARIIGINNRNLETFVVDLDRFQSLRNLIPKGIAVVSESGIRGSKDALKMKEYQADAILVGTSIMESDCLVSKIESLRV